MTESGKLQQLSAYFEQLSKLPTEQQEAELQNLADKDPALASELRSLLASDQQAQHWFGELAADLGQQRAAEIDASWAQNRSIGPYQLLGLLGTGGMGSVFRARRADGQIDRDVALKIVPAGLDSPQAIQRFEHERDILARLSHPHIALLLDAGLSEDGKPWIALEYVRGQAITRWCDEQRLDVRARIRLFLQLATAVQFAHRNLVVHRDLKPGNVLVNAEGQVKLLDFGIAKLMGDGQFETATAARLLTPAYAAPEQILGQPLSTATDVWALGVILHELLTGLRPRNSLGRHTDSTDSIAPSRLLSAHASGRLDTDEPKLDQLADMRRAKPEGLSRLLRGDLDIILLKALNHEPERRYSSAGQMADDLQRFLSGQPISARPDSLGYRLTKLVRRHPWAASAAVAVLSASIGFAIFTQQQARKLALERDRAEQVSEFLVEVFTVSSPDQAQGQEISAKDLLARGVERLDTELGDEPELAARFLSVLGRTHQSIGDYQTADELLERALLLHREQLQSSPQDLVPVLLDLGEARRLGGNYEAAAELLEEALQATQPGGPAADPHLLADAMSRLGRVVGLIGDQQRSFELMTQALALTRDAEPVDPLVLARRLNDLASAHFRAGQFAQAQTLLEESLALHRQVDASSNIAIGRPETATALNNVALAHYLQGNLELAEPLFREALEMRTQILTADHPDLAQTYTNLGLLLRDTGQLDDAEPALRKALRIRSSALEGKHPLVAQAQNNLAMLLETQGQYAESEQLFRNAAEILTENLGPQHPQLASVHTNLGNLLLADSRPAKARAAFAQSLEIRRAALPPEHPYLAWSLVGLARADLALGDPGAALPSAREALNIRSGALPADDPQVGEAEWALGVALMETGDLSNAQQHLSRAQEILASRAGDADRLSDIKMRLGELQALLEARTADELE